MHALAISSIVGLTELLAGTGSSLTGAPNSYLIFSISFYVGDNDSKSTSGSFFGGSTLLELSKFLKGLFGSHAESLVPLERGISPSSIAYLIA